MHMKPCMESEMKKEILTALKGSVKKWEKIVDGTGKDATSHNCPLCLITEPSCGDCPVRLKTGEWDCESSPYDKWTNHQRKVHNKKTWQSKTIICKWCEKFAQAELDFLKSLLPGGE